MKAPLTRADFIWAGVILCILFVLLPAGLIGLSAWRSHERKEKIHKMVPGIVQDAQQTLQTATTLLVQESIPSTDYYANQERTKQARSVIYDACKDISSSITARSSEFRTDQYFCSLYIKQGDGYLTANRHNTYPTTYEYDLKDLKDLEAAPEVWRLYPNSRDWRVKYKLQTSPLVVLDFAVVAKEEDYLK